MTSSLATFVVVVVVVLVSVPNVMHDKILCCINQ